MYVVALMEWFLSGWRFFECCAFLLVFLSPGYGIGRTPQIYRSRSTCTVYKCICCSIYIIFDSIHLKLKILTFLQIVDKSKRDPTEEIEVRIPILNNVLDL